MRTFEIVINFGGGYIFYLFVSFCAYLFVTLHPENENLLFPVGKLFGKQSFLE